MSYIAFWVYLILWVCVSLYFIITRKFSLVDFILCLTVFMFSDIADDFLSEMMHQYYFLNKQSNEIYMMLYQILVYPAMAIVFSKLYPKKATFLALTIYSMACGLFLTLQEELVLNRFGIIHYETWTVIPGSLIFYIAGFPLFTIYYRIINKVINRRRD